MAPLPRKCWRNSSKAESLSDCSGYAGSGEAARCKKISIGAREKATFAGSPIPCPRYPAVTAQKFPLPAATPRVIVVLPAYNEARTIAEVLLGIPALVIRIVVVDDGSTDETREVAEALVEVDSRIEVVSHEYNRGVGAAMVTGFRRALELGADVVVKMDADAQMNPDDLPALIAPLVEGRGDMAKGNRFRDFAALQRMPPLRRMGNLVLSFLTKMAVGYYHCFDPCNGFLALQSEVLARVPLERLDRSYFFETSLLAELYLLGAVVIDVPMRARYGGEISHLSVPRVMRQFPWRLTKCLAKRLWLRNFIYDFNMQSVYMLASLLLLLGGIGYGGGNWLRYAWLGVGAPTGTVVIPAMLIILGFQLLLSAVQEDIRAVPQVPLTATLNRRPPIQSTIPMHTEMVLEGE